MSSYNLLTNANYCCLYYELWYDLTIKEPHDKTQNAELSAPDYIIYYQKMDRT